MIAQLCIAAALAFCPRVAEVDSFPQRAMVNPWIGTIYISRGLARNKDELAFVLAHELGHVHYLPYVKTEAEIDAYAITLIVPLGYDCKRGIEVLRRVKEFERWRLAKEKCTWTKN